jgi:hypothetical protein
VYIAGIPLMPSGTPSPSTGAPAASASPHPFGASGASSVVTSLFAGLLALLTAARLLRHE